MNLDKILGPATLVYLASATVTALWWASDLTARVHELEASKVTGERIAKLEASVDQLAESNRELKSSIQDLLREMRKGR